LTTAVAPGRFDDVKSIIPQDRLFFDEFDALCRIIVQGVAELVAQLQPDAKRDVVARRVKAFESEADEVVHRTMEHLHRTFVTPFDRQDIRKLLTRLDDVMDLAEAASSRVDMYQPKMMLDSARDLAEVLLASSKQVQELVGLLRDLKKGAKRAAELTVEINRLENEADGVRRRGIAWLFQEERDAIELIKWKDILEHIEQATDRCEDVADLVSGLVLEYT
jgi:predicted phosphate transport protein (TIGR00153 family)